MATTARAVAQADTEKRAWQQDDIALAEVGLRASGYVFSARTHDHRGRMAKPLVLRCLDESPVTAQWAAYYLDHGFFEADAIYRICLHATRPVWWTNASSKAPVPGYERSWSSTQIEIFRSCLKETGIQNGVSVPLHSTFGGFGYVAFTEIPGANAWSPHDRDVENILMGAAHRIHDSLKDEAASDNTQGIELSWREIECLRHLADGKTLEDTAELMQISYSTVRFHLRRCCEKLGVFDRIRAVAKAAYLGLLGPVH